MGHEVEQEIVCTVGKTELLHGYFPCVRDIPAENRQTVKIGFYRAGTSYRLRWQINIQKIVCP